MNHWLFKSEPSVWSWSDQAGRGEAGEEWDGVRNYQARNNMRAMQVGDLGFFYHTDEAREIVGVVVVIREAAPDPTSDDPRWECVRVRAVEALPRPVTLEAVRGEPRLAEMALVRQARLSVQPVRPEEWRLIRTMGGLDD